MHINHSLKYSHKYNIIFNVEFDQLKIEIKKIVHAHIFLLSSRVRRTFLQQKQSKVMRKTFFPKTSQILFRLEFDQLRNE